ncbi:MAG: hypothetical protein SH847_16820 [Roseiflexaceae bacterium]|nr:hypothetical protein [Roseiflexaceae bacterium]
MRILLDTDVILDFLLARDPFAADAQAMSMPDFEDAVQLAAAMASGLDAIVTRNGDDYTLAPIPILTPTEFLRVLQTVA